MPVAGSDGIGIAYDVMTRAGPDAPWLVLVHGLGYARWGWEPVLDPLGDHFRLVTIDNRGIGASGAPPGPYDTATMADDVLAVIDHAGLERVHVLGTSLGGMVAQQLTLRAPERIDRLVLVCTTPGGDVAYPLPQATLELIARMPYLPADGALELAVRNALAPDTLANRPDVARRILKHRRANPQDPDAWSAQAAAGTGHRLGRRVSAITHPTLVLHGDEDRVVDVRNAGVLAELIPHGHAVVMAGLGHLLFWDDPDRFATEVVPFLHGIET